MGCGASSNNQDAPSDPAANHPIVDRIVSFKDLVEEPDNLLEPESKSHEKNVHSATSMLQESTEQEKKAAIERSLQLRPATAGGGDSSSSMVKDVSRKHYFPNQVPVWDEEPTALHRPNGGKSSDNASSDISFPELRRPSAADFAAKKLQPMFPEIRRPGQQLTSPNSFFGDSGDISSDAVPQAILQLEKNQRDKMYA